MIPKPRISRPDLEHLVAENKRLKSLLSTCPDHKKGYDRFVANHVLLGLVRPQGKHECSINAVAGALNSLFNTSLRRDDVLRLARWDADDVVEGEIGNEEMLLALKNISRLRRWNAHAEIFVPSIPAVRHQTTWERLKEAICDRQSVLILHMKNHYCLIAGYVEEPQSLSDLDKPHYARRRDWLVIAEHSTEWDTPIRLIKWQNVRSGVNSSPLYAILRVSAKP